MIFTWQRCEIRKLKRFNIINLQHFSYDQVKSLQMQAFSDLDYCLALGLDAQAANATTFFAFVVVGK